MVRLFGFIDRREDFSEAEFSVYWRTVHVREALKLKRFIVRYVQNHFWPTTLEGLLRPADGCPQLWFKSPADLAAMPASEEYLTGAFLDEQRFMRGRARGVAMTETVVLPEPAYPCIKAMFFYAAAPGVSLAQFAAEHQGAEGPALISATRAIGHVRSAALPGPDAPLYAGADEVWWATQAEFEADWAERPALPAWLDAPQCAGCRVDELRVF